MVHAVNGVSVLRVINRPEPFSSPSKVALSKAMIAIAQLDCSMLRTPSNPVSPMNQSLYVAGGVEITNISEVSSRPFTL